MSDGELLRRPVTELAELVRTRELAARELVAASLEAIDARNPVLNAFVALDPERALADAAIVDERIQSGEDVGPLAGIPLGVKDLEDAIGFSTTHGSALHRDEPRATSDSVLVARLRAAGCVVVGKTNTPEYGWRPDSSNPLFGSTRNPWSTARSSGGSSGGSSAAIAGGLVPLATGSDGGGSIRIPSAVCGLSGLKPSLGRVPTGGAHAPDWQHLSTKGVLATRIADVAAALDCVVGPDPTDLRSLPHPDVPWGRSLHDIGAPHRVAWSPTLGYAAVDREVRDACERAVGVLADLGAEIVEVDTVFDKDPAWEWLTLAGSYLRRSVFDALGTPAQDLIDPGLVGVIELVASSVGPIELVRAEDRCHELNVRLVELFHECSLLLTPTVAGQTPLAGEVSGTIDGVTDMNWVRLTYPFNMTRSPAGTVCVGFTADGMPIGLQLIGPQHADVAVLRGISLLEDALALDRVPPPLG